jgi:hypothetical protein
MVEDMISGARAALTRLSCLAVGAMLATAIVWGLAAPVAAQQGKDLSDQSVNALMNYAWALTPPRFTPPNGKEIIVDKTKRDQVVVPLDVAREVVRVARISAHAELCGLPEDQASNYRTMMAREEAKAKWSEQQLLYISQLHLFTVQLLSGRVLLEEKDGEKNVVLLDTAKSRAKQDTCSDTERAKVRNQIKSYVEAAPAKK